MTSRLARESGGSAAAHLGGMDESPAAPTRPSTCRTCGRPITHETRTDPGFKPRTGWYDDARVDPLVCYSAASLVHAPAAA